MRSRPAWCWRKRGVEPRAHEAELTVVPAVLATLPLHGRIVTGDALYCQRELCQQLVAAGGDYVVIVKANQPQLLADVALLFADPPWGEVVATAESCDRHGDRGEHRRLRASTALRGYLDWPGAHQVCQIERVTARQGKVTCQVRYALTSLGPAQADAARLLALVRGHWAIENRLHYVRDVTFGEDACQVRMGSAPQVLAALRNTVLGLLRHAGVTNVAAALREHSWRPGAVLEFLGLADEARK